MNKTAFCQLQNAFCQFQHNILVEQIFEGKIRDEGVEKSFGVVITKQTNTYYRAEARTRIGDKYKA